MKMAAKGPMESLTTRPDPKINIHCLARAHAWILPLEKSDLTRVLTAMANECVKLGENLGSVELYLADDAHIAWFNKNRLRINGPTNILSFPDGAGNGTLLLSVDTYNRECLIYNQDRRHYLLRLLAHGLAHLAGYNHGPRLDFISNCCLQKGLVVLSCAVPGHEQHRQAQSDMPPVKAR